MTGLFGDTLVILAGLTRTEVRRAETAFAGLCEVLAVQDDEGLELAMKSRVPAVVVMDIEKPAMNAPESLRRIREDPRNSETVVLQAAGGTANLIDAPGAPPAWACHLPKPVTGVPLLQKAWVLRKLAGLRSEAEGKGRELEAARAEIAELRRELAARGEAASGTGPAGGAGGSGRVARLQATLLSAVTSLVEFRDDVTGGHVTRTTRWLELLLEGLDEAGLYADETRGWDRETVLQSSKLHDVGKIAVSDAILKKTAPLTPGEYEEMKRHAAAGGEIIDGIRATLPESDAEFMDHARLLAVGHHEKWDGTVYPLGLAGSAISVQGRLMAVSDVYDALVSRRPYKSPMPHDRAAEIILKGSGTHFDPAIAGVFESVRDRFRDSLAALTG
ncbi:MAG: HD domain-containing protein [Deltaproteobacteria bacterium]|jgi:putative two-component system response regulator|nr:HD domain-containing protein [Deltaproteobacteria bacterium]